MEHIFNFKLLLIAKKGGRIERIHKMKTLKTSLLLCCMSIFVAFLVIGIRSAEAGKIELFHEDFEDGTLDPRAIINTVGAYNTEPGIKDITDFGSSKGFGFGRSTCFGSCFGKHVTSFDILFDEPSYISSVTFNEKELFSNWGSKGVILVNGDLLTAGVNPVGNGPFDFSRIPSNDHRADISFRSWEFGIDQTVSSISLRVVDITSSSELYIDDISLWDNRTVTPVPEPTTIIMLGIGLTGLALICKCKKKAVAKS